MSLGTTRKMMFLLPQRHCDETTTAQEIQLNQSIIFPFDALHLWQPQLGLSRCRQKLAPKIHQKKKQLKQTYTRSVARARVEKEDPCHDGNDAAVYDPQHKKRYDLWNIHRLLKLSTIERALQLRANQHFVCSDH